MCGGVRIVAPTTRPPSSTTAQYAGSPQSERRHPQPRREPEDQVVLGLARAEELARVREEVVGVLVPRQLHPRRLNRNASEVLAGAGAPSNSLC